MRRLAKIAETSTTASSAARHAHGYWLATCPRAGEDVMNAPAPRSIQALKRMRANCANCAIVRSVCSVGMGEKRLSTMRACPLPAPLPAFIPGPMVKSRSY